ncbi:SprT family protein [Lacticaseibacillus hulanensis]|uniref:SprT family protein n=1 Tax=Lacticaseibacillus hulanensis TaxID=2493111 RepID=UPI000FDB92BA|nr:SprT family protein [Lacticaseibacillus hulanensis]
MTNQELQARVETISMKYFGRPFVNVASFNGRLRRAAGRFLPATQNLDFSSKLFAQYDEATQNQIIKHELTHYHLYRQHRGYQHRDADFKALLRQVGGTRYAPTPRVAEATRYVIYQCRSCATLYPRKRHLNTKRYVCSRCHGKLQEVGSGTLAELKQRGLVENVR